MVIIFWVSEVFVGVFEFIGKVIFVVFINWCIGVVIWYMLIVVILDIFQCFQVVLNVWIFVVVNEIIVCQWWVRCFKVDFVVWVYFFFYIEVEIVGVVIFIGYVWYYVKFSSIEMVEVIVQVFIWCVVEIEIIICFFFLLIYCLMQMFNNGDIFCVKLFVVVNMFVVEQCVNGFVDVDVIQ